MKLTIKEWICGGIGAGVLFGMPWLFQIIAWAM